MLQVWMIHPLPIIGEAASRLSAEPRDVHPGVPWEEIIAMRNILVHQHFGVDLEEVWTTITVLIPRLGQDAARIPEEQG